MRAVNVSSVEDLAVALEGFGHDALFRGQTKHYGSDETTGLKSSFDRQGCVPPVMIKWAHYAEFMLRQVATDPSVLDQLAFVQAVLQHYGWRSFYLDLSASPAVSAFFAGWRWTSQRHVELVEDCFEDPVCAVQTLADYEPFDGCAHLYVISKAAIAAAGIGVHDLGELALWADGQTRYQAQQAWLAGHLHGDLPLDCVLARISGPGAIFRSYAAAGGFADVSNVFPPSAVDPVLELLFSLPWIEISGSGELGNSEIGFYRRSLDIPEYREGYLVQHQPAGSAFFSGQKLASLVSDLPVVVRSMPAQVIFGSYGEEPVFPKVTALVREHKIILFETDELIWLPESVQSTVWGKGLWVEETPDGLLKVGDLIVRHPGRKLTNVGALSLWTYMADEAGRWSRSAGDDDCPCGNVWRHEAHLSALGILENELNRRADLFKLR